MREAQWQVNYWSPTPHHLHQTCLHSSSDSTLRAMPVTCLRITPSFLQRWSLDCPTRYDFVHNMVSSKRNCSIFSSTTSFIIVNRTRNLYISARMMNELNWTSHYLSISVLWYKHVEEDIFVVQVKQSATMGSPCASSVCAAVKIDRKKGSTEAQTSGPQNKSLLRIHYITKLVKIGNKKSALWIVKYKDIGKNDCFQVFEFYICSICLPYSKCDCYWYNPKYY